MTNNNDDYEVCLRAENVILPKNGYFGVSAATGGLADDHDVFHFLTTSLHPPNQVYIYFIMMIYFLIYYFGIICNASYKIAKLPNYKIVIKVLLFLFLFEKLKHV